MLTQRVPESNRQCKKLTSDQLLPGLFYQTAVSLPPAVIGLQKEFAAPPPLLFRKLSNPDLSPAATTATKSKLHRQLSQDESRARRSSLAMTGKQLLPLSCSLHAGVSQLASQGPSGVLGGPGALGGPSGGGGDGNNMVRMRSQVLGQSAPSLTGLQTLWLLALRGRHVLELSRSSGSHWIMDPEMV
ncbi:hypothetical protein CRENBAI_008111 [Crenichthys baileyi]|uniref:Uncharacterized protein n=1 Tax=Crenichthys baileyi TaxID=28760 RepID=A0AAV9R780_9TELE